MTRIEAALPEIGELSVIDLQLPVSLECILLSEASKSRASECPSIPCHKLPYTFKSPYSSLKNLCYFTIRSLANMSPSLKQRRSSFSQERHYSLSGKGWKYFRPVSLIKHSDENLSSFKHQWRGASYECSTTLPFRQFLLPDLHKESHADHLLLLCAGEAAPALSEK